ncbi:hypothetical protein DH2020_000286 [Rehmannia glutinosa]|uniref:Exostosin GT47 domain-containing protein n=1 Tax=Rehmannia glutinosa TaxID=99300 RepID=A0ABR0XW23_REHGL
MKVYVYDLPPRFNIEWLSNERCSKHLFASEVAIHRALLKSDVRTRVRTAIWRRYGGDRRFYLRRHRFAGYQSEIVRSTFCLCPLGWAPWSPRLVEAVALGCVPVIIADGIRLPFPSAVPWPEISLTVAEADVDKLGKILEHVASTNLTSIQRNIWDPQVRRALLFHDPILEGDATWQVLVALSEKLDRSHRRSRVLTQ